MDIATILNALLSRLGKKHVSLIMLRDNLSEEERQSLGLKKSSNQKAVTAALGDLPPGFAFLKKSSSLYLIQGKVDDILLSAVRTRPGKTVGQLAVTLPLTKDTLREMANRMLAGGLLSARISPQDKVRLYPGLSPAGAEPEKKEEIAMVPADTRERIAAFKKAHDQAARGDYYVHIYKIRRLLNWPRDVFDQLMDHLMVEGYVLANPGNPARLTDDQIRDCYRDDFGDIYITVNWKVRS